MINRRKYAYICCLAWLVIFDVEAYADRLIRRSDARIVSIGVGTLDERKETVLFKGCADKEGKIFSLKKYVFQSGKDCDGPPIFAVLHALKIDGAIKASTSEGCSYEKSCLRFIVQSPKEAENVFDRAQKGDVIDVFVRPNAAYDAALAKYPASVNLTLILRATRGDITDTVTFKGVSASDSFIKTITK